MNRNWYNQKANPALNAFCIYENKGTDQLRARTSNQRARFCYKDSVITALQISEISSHLPSSVALQPGYRTSSETPILCRGSFQYGDVESRKRSKRLSAIF